MTTASALSSFLRAVKNSKSREFLITTRVIHDLTVAAAVSGYDLLVYTPTVDRDGFDLILDDRDRLLPLQLKSVIGGGRAAKWAMHRSLLRPERREVEWFGFEPSPCGEGRGGGVCLIEIQSNEASVDIIYRFTDICILAAIWLGLIQRSAASKKRLDKLRIDLAAHPNGKVNVSRSAFVRARTPEALLALAGLHSRHISFLLHQGR